MTCSEPGACSGCDNGLHPWGSSHLLIHLCEIIVLNLSISICLELQ